MTFEEDHNSAQKVTDAETRSKRTKGMPIAVMVTVAFSSLSIVGSLVWSIYIVGQNISENLTHDYGKVQNSQATLINDAQELRDDLLNPNVMVPLEEELNTLREYAQQSIASLGALRAPSDRIEAAKHAYRDALQDLIAASNGIARGNTDGTALQLHNALQGIANEGGGFNEEISHFQGGMWPKLKAAVF